MTGLDNDYASYLTLLADGDVIGEDYGVFEDNQRSWYSIDEYDEANKFVKGRFEVVFYTTPEAKLLPNSPDTVRMTNGIFEVQFE